MATPTFDLESAIKGLREGKDLTGKNGVLTPLIKPVEPQFNNPILT